MRPRRCPTFKANNDKPLLYVSFGSLGSGDTDLLKRLITAIGKMPVRALVNVGDYMDQYADMPDNVIIDKWFPQPSVIPKVDAVIHHGGNNSFTECLYFGKPAIIMPYVWDGHDNATRVQETGHGFKMDRYDWTDERNAGQDHGHAHRQEDEGQAQEDQYLHARQTRPHEGRQGDRWFVETQDHLMPTNFTSSAPHLESPATYAGPLKDWGHQPNPIAGNSKSDGVLLYKGPNNQPECGLWQVHARHLALAIPRDELLPLRLGPRHLHPREWRGHRSRCPAQSCCSRPAGPASAPSTKPCVMFTCWLEMTCSTSTPPLPTSSTRKLSRPFQGLGPHPHHDRG